MIHASYPRLRSFSQAADEMHLTNAALTKSIKTLEHKWDVQLFHRTTRRVSPTAAGHRLYEKVPLFLAEAEALRQTAMREQRHIRLMCGPVVLDTLVHPALLALRKQYADSLISAETSPEAAFASFDDAQELTKGQIGVGRGAELVGDACEYLVVVEGLECPQRVQQCSSLLRLDEAATSETARSG